MITHLIFSTNLGKDKFVESVGFNFPAFCKLIKNLYLTPNTSKDRDLDNLYSLRFQHGLNTLSILAI